MGIILCVLFFSSLMVKLSYSRHHDGSPKACDDEVNQHVYEHATVSVSI